MIRQVVVAAAVACTALAAPAEERAVAAIVNGSAIDAERLERYFEGDFLTGRRRNVASIRSPTVYRRLKREALDALVVEELLWQEARRRGQVASDPDVEAELARLRARYPGPEDLSRALERAGLRPERLADEVRRQLSIGRLVQALQSSAVASPLEELIEDLKARASIRIAPWLDP